MLEWIRKLLPDMFAFVLGIVIAWYYGWQTTDLVWSLWLSSLVVGYLTILATIVGGVYLGFQVSKHPEFPADKKPLAFAIGIPSALFFLGFFSLHFCGFHAGHATFLQSFFPLDNIESADFGMAFMNPFKLWHIVFTQILPIYGLFLIPVILSERNAIFKSLKNAADFSEKISRFTKSDGDNLNTNQDAGDNPRKKKKSNPMGDLFAGPYKNVIRMHLLIFVFAGFAALEVESYWIFVFVYFLYFFPWRHFKFGNKAEVGLQADSD